MTLPFKIDIDLRSNEGKFALFVCFFWVQRAWQPYLHAIVKMFSDDSTADSIVLAFKTVLLLLAFPSIKKRFRPGDVFYYIFILCLYIMSLLTSNEEAGPYLLSNFWLIMVCTVPLYYGGAYIKLNKYIDLFYVLSLLVIIGEFMFTVLYQMNMDDITGEQMARAYGLLPHVLLAWYYMFRKFNLFSAFAAILSFVVMFTCGTRGPILGFLVFIILYILQTLFSTKLKFSTLLITVFVIGGVIYSIDLIFDGLASFAEDFNMSMRVIDRLEAGDVGESYGREHIKGILMNQFNMYPFAFRGIAGDMMNGIGYAHNIVIEMLVSFGAFLGPLFLLIITFLIVRGYFSTKDKDEKTFILILIGAYIVQLFVSSTYRESTGFFFLIGFCVQMARNRSRSREGRIKIINQDNHGTE